MVRGSVLLSRTFVLLAVLVLTAQADAARAAEPDIAGRWRGAIKVPGAELKIDIDFVGKAGDWKGDISIPAQGAVDLPLAEIRFTDGTVSFRLPGIPGDPAFRGKPSADGASITGDFTQGGQTMPFELSRGADAGQEAGERLAGFDEFVEQGLKDWNVPGLAVGVVVEDEVVYAKGFGYRDLESKLPVTPKTLFAIGSCTKAFTAFAMGTLVDERKLEWDKPVVNYIPEFKVHDEHATQHITPRDLVTHRSGLPRHDLAWYNNPHARGQLMSTLRHLPPNKDLRERYEYNNLMFVAAGHLVGQLSGGSWEDAVGERIFQPVGMNHSNFSVDDSQKSDDFSLPYEEKDDAILRMKFRNIDNVGPAGSINSNIEDMTQWVIVHLNKGKIGGRKIIGETTLADLHTPYMAIAAIPEEPEFSPASYALGWVVDTYRGHYRVSHGGAIDGFNALVTLFPRDRVGIVALANKSGAGFQAIVSLHAADRLLGLAPKDWNRERLEKRATGKAAQKEAEKKKETVRRTGTQPAHILAEYAGEYDHPGYGTLKIDLRGEQLEMHFNNIETHLTHWHYEVFNGLRNPEDHTFEDFKLRFLTNMKGDVDAIAAPFEPSVEEIVFRRKPDSRMSDPGYLSQFTGAYELSGQTVTVGLQGNVLTVSVPGQPLYELIPDRNDEFNLKGLTGFSVRFVKADGESIMAVFNQPNGVFEAKRKSG